MPKFRVLRVVNPRRKKSAAQPRKRKVSARRSAPKRRNRRNPLLGGGELALMTNPRKKKSKNSHRRRSNPRRRAVIRVFNSRRRRHSNPFAKARRYHRRRRNPIVSGASVMDLMKIGVSAAAGGVGARALTQAVLSNNNTGYVGYAGNFAASLLLAWAADKFLGKDYGVGVAAGGISALAMRVWTEKVSQTSPNALSGMGDLDFSSNGMGDYINSYYAMPATPTRNAQGYLINTPPTAPALAAGKKGMGAIAPVARFRTRWA